MSKHPFLLAELTGILCTGQVRRTAIEQGIRTLHIDFTDITEADQELIIKHNMTLQLEQARARHHDID